MKHINDILKESLPDDDLESTVDNQMLGEWMKENLSGKYKVTSLKDGTLKFRGEVMIKNYNGEAFPSNFVISFMQGDFKIEKCPNLKNIHGLFKPYTDVDGDYVISNCPKLESVDGGPMTVKGTLSFTSNSSLKSLEGMPQFIYETIYIMKNGKKFSQKYIESYTSLPKRIVCSLEEEVNEYVVNEALNEPHLLELIKQLKANGRRVKSYIGDTNVQLDQLDSSNVKEYSKIDARAIKSASEIVRASDIFGFIILVDYDGSYLCFINNHKKCIPIKQGYKPHNYYRFREYGEMMSYTDIMNEIKVNAHSLIVVKWGFEERNVVYKLRSDRSTARDGMIFNTPEQNEEIAKENVERYKKLAAQMKAQKDKNLEAIDAAVEEIVMEVLKMSQEAKRNPNKYESYQIRHLNEMIYGEEHYTGYNSRTKKSTMGEDGLLKLYTEYTTTYADILKTGGDKWDRNSLRNKERRILDAIDNIRTTIKIYK